LTDIFEQRKCSNSFPVHLIPLKRDLLSLTTMWNILVCMNYLKVKQLVMLSFFYHIIQRILHNC